MIGKEEYYVRCKYCGQLIKVFKEPTRAYCTNCEKMFDYDTQDIVLSGISTVPSDYHYEWKEEKNIENQLTKYKRAFEILKDTLTLSNRDEEYYLMGDFYDKITKEEYELLEELMKSESR